MDIIVVWFVLRSTTTLSLARRWMAEVGFVVRKWSKELNSPTPSVLECWMNCRVSLKRRLLIPTRYPYAETVEGSLGNCFDTGYGSLGHSPGLRAGTEVRMRAEESR